MKASNLRKITKRAIRCNSKEDLKRESENKKRLVAEVKEYVRENKKRLLKEALSGIKFRAQHGESSYELELDSSEDYSPESKACTTGLFIALKKGISHAYGRCNYCLKDTPNFHEARSFRSGSDLSPWDMPYRPAHTEITWSIIISW